MRTDDVLSIWEERWFTLRPDEREKFVERAEAKALAEFPLEVVRRALRENRKLSDALQAAEAHAAGKKRLRPKEVPPAVRGERSRVERRGATVRKPPRVEKAAGLDRCSSCGGLVVDGRCACS